MKQIKNVVIFACDNCGTLSEEIEEGTGFPYDAGWVYLFGFGIKTRREKQTKSNDKHFCSSLCLKRYINKKIERSEGNAYQDS